MEMQENDEQAEDQGYDAEIYSRMAIFWFTLIFSPLFGGIMLVLNMRWAGYRREALSVLLFSVFYYLGENFLLGSLGLSLVALGGLSLVLNAIGYVMLLFFYNRYFPERDYYPKSVIGPLIVAFLLILLSIWLSPNMTQLIKK